MSFPLRLSFVSCVVPVLYSVLFCSSTGRERENRFVFAVEHTRDDDDDDDDPSIHPSIHSKNERKKKKEEERKKKKR